jgi:hypothetical protein
MSGADGLHRPYAKPPSVPQNRAAILKLPLGRRAQLRAFDAARLSRLLKLRDDEEVAAVDGTADVDEAVGL